MPSWPRPSKDAILLIKPERSSGLCNPCWEKEQRAALASLSEVGCPQGMGEDPSQPPHPSRVIHSWEPHLSFLKSRRWIV